MRIKFFKALIISGLCLVPLGLLAGPTEGSLTQCDPACSVGYTCDTTTGTCIKTGGGGGGVVIQTHCYIYGKTYSAMEENPSNPCQYCDPNKNAEAWSNKAYNTVCTDDSNACTLDVCNANGECLHTAKTNQKCDDGNACTTDEKCNSAGQCSGGLTKICNDNKVCTKDTCNSAIGCVYTNEFYGVACTSDSKLCTDDICNGDGACIHHNNTASCDDKLKCTAGDVCGSGSCAGIKINCDDGLSCTTDNCDSTTGGCKHTAQSLKCLIGGACYSNGASNPSNPCQVCNTTLTKYAWSNKTDGTSCADSDKCDGAETCKAGVCTDGTAVTCNDSNACTTDTCTSATGACQYTMTPTAATETCNNKDDNCNGSVDESLTQLCGATDVGECEYGTQTCTKGMWGACGGTYKGSSAEICDGKDNNCDGETDEGVKNTCGGCGVVPAETCNGKDDDCDGSTDEGFSVGTSCTSGIAACKAGALQCKADSTGTQCVESGNVANGTICSDGDLCTTSDACKDGVCSGTAKSCNDNSECTIDSCSNGVCSYKTNTSYGETCSVSNEFGTCTGVKKCLVTGNLGECSASPQIEICGNNIDDDCDGTTDEFATYKDGMPVDIAEDEQCYAGVGACKGLGVYVCNSSGKPECNAKAGTPLQVDLCDATGVDEDCDGESNEGCDCIDGKVQACYSGGTATVGVGVCKAGTQTCAKGKWGACVGEQLGGAESCDGLDNDCDGAADEGLGGSACGACKDGVMTCNGSEIVCVGAATDDLDKDGTPDKCDKPECGNGVIESDEACEDKVTQFTDPTKYCESCQIKTKVIPDCAEGEKKSCANGMSLSGCVEGELTCEGGKWSGCRNVFKKDGVSCDDGDACTQGESCSAGECKGGLDVVGCCRTEGMVSSCSVRAEFGTCAGTQVCKSNKWVECSAASPVAETCNGKDDDCDHEIDEGLTRECASACGKGTETCVVGQWDGCNAAKAETEICDSRDNDCDGLVDEDLGQTTCGEGECQKTVDNCLNGIAQACMPDSGCGEPVAEKEEPPVEEPPAEEPKEEIVIPTESSKIFDLAKTRAVQMQFTKISSIKFTGGDQIMIVDGCDESACGIATIKLRELTGFTGMSKAVGEGEKKVKFDEGEGVAGMGSITKDSNGGDLVTFDKACVHIKPSYSGQLDAGGEIEETKICLPDSLKECEIEKAVTEDVNADLMTDVVVLVKCADGKKQMTLTNNTENPGELKQEVGDVTAADFLDEGPKLDKELKDKVEMAFGTEFAADDMAKKAGYGYFDKIDKKDILVGGSYSIKYGYIDDSQQITDSGTEVYGANAPLDGILNTADAPYKDPSFINSAALNDDGGPDAIAVWQASDSLWLFSYFNINEAPSVEITEAEDLLSAKGSDLTNDKLTYKWSCKDATGSDCSSLLSDTAGETVTAADAAPAKVLTPDISINATLGKAVGDGSYACPFAVTVTATDPGDLSGEDSIDISCEGLLAKGIGSTEEEEDESPPVRGGSIWGGGGCLFSVTTARGADLASVVMGLILMLGMPLGLAAVRIKRK